MVASTGASPPSRVALYGPLNVTPAIVQNDRCDSGWLQSTLILNNNNEITTRFNKVYLFDVNLAYVG